MNRNAYPKLLLSAARIRSAPSSGPSDPSRKSRGRSSGATFVVVVRSVVPLRDRNLPSVRSSVVLPPPPTRLTSSRPCPPNPNKTKKARTSLCGGVSEGAGSADRLMGRPHRLASSGRSATSTAAPPAAAERATASARSISR